MRRPHSNEQKSLTKASSVSLGQILGAALTKGAALGWRSFRSWSSCTADPCARKAVSAKAPPSSSACPWARLICRRNRSAAHAPLASRSVGAAPFVEEALRWLPDGEARDAEPLPILPPAIYPATDESRPRLLVADDNADLRQYLARLLAERYNVQTVPDGQAAVAAARDRRPDLVLSDVMMPNMDGLDLLRELRADAALSTVPVILLSARAGEESRIEGLQEGADDYLVKPFSARELMARVPAHLELARIRKASQEAIRESEERYQSLRAGR